MERERLLLDPKTGTLTYEKITDVTDIINANDDAQKDGTNGFTRERGYRRISSIPNTVFHKMAKETGYYQADRQGRKVIMTNFLNKHPEYRTVERLVTQTPHPGNIIIR